ncbi:MAG: type II toxin-antitoxin system PemK/MazF family toxin [Rhodoferax sp.]
MGRCATHGSGDHVVAVFDRGDIVFLSLEPVAGREMHGKRRYALVLTTKEFNALNR